ncbi:hypothetical protein DFH06DRAFT_52747 [Mycena polygramma]|nr:hypothetical protein DFH06DRAFT_52747 [Mycena polygramma]
MTASGASFPSSGVAPTPPRRHSRIARLSGTSRAEGVWCWEAGLMRNDSAGPPLPKTLVWMSEYPFLKKFILRLEEFLLFLLHHLRRFAPRFSAFLPCISVATVLSPLLPHHDLFFPNPLSILTSIFGSTYFLGPSFDLLLSPRNPSVPLPLPISRSSPHSLPFGQIPIPVHILCYSTYPIRCHSSSHPIPFLWRELGCAYSPRFFRSTLPVLSYVLCYPLPSHSSHLPPSRMRPSPSFPVPPRVSCRHSSASSSSFVVLAFLRAPPPFRRTYHPPLPSSLLPRYTPPSVLFPSYPLPPTPRRPFLSYPDLSRILSHRRSDLLAS